MKSWLKENLLLTSWVIALLSMTGSLYFSDVLGFAPCILCWYQRICVYPMVFILAVGIMRKDSNVSYYILPLSIVGGVIAFYHNLLYYSFIPESLAPCVAGVSCTTKFFQWFGFISIPLLSLIGFVIITLLMIWHHRTRE